MNELIENNCKRCINYEICQSTGCVIKNNIEQLIKENQQLKEKLIKYLEDKIKERKYDNDFFRYTAYQDILEKVKSDKYE